MESVNAQVIRGITAQVASGALHASLRAPHICLPSFLSYSCYNPSQRLTVSSSALPLAGILTSRGRCAMRRDKDAFDPSQPALLVTYGNTARKHRHLDGSVLVLGRSNVCDFSLVSPEVAPVHCV